MFNARYATIAATLSAALLSVGSSAFGAINTGWTQLSPSPPGTIISVAAFPAGVYAATTSGIYVDYLVNNPAIWYYVSSTVATQITSDSGDNLYIINKQGVPQKWTGTSFTWIDPVNSPGAGNNGCPRPSDIAVGEYGHVFVVGCGNNELWSTSPSSNWGQVGIGPSNVNLVAVGANQIDASEWVIDANGGTWLVNLSGNSAQQYARPEYLQPRPHAIGVFGGSNQAMGIGGGNPNGNGDYPIVFWANPGWSWPYLGGWAHMVSTNSYTAAVVAANLIFAYSLD